MNPPVEQLSTPTSQARTRKLISEADATGLVQQADEVLQFAEHVLEEARGVAAKAGLSIESELLSTIAKQQSASSATTGGHCNTDHIIKLTGDYMIDRIADLRRNMLNRLRSEHPEHKGEVRWDKPRAPGERRRRIVREVDLPEAPPEPPPSGYVIFVGQMTAKIRSERPNERHSQTKIVQEIISKQWKITMSDDEKKYYNDFCEELRKEYKKQNLEYRATGTYTPSERFERVEKGLWVKKNAVEKNELEREIATLETVQFPPRPPEFEEEYKQRELESKRRRKEKLRAEAAAKRLASDEAEHTTVENDDNGEESIAEESEVAASKRHASDEVVRTTMEDDDNSVEDIDDGIERFVSDRAVRTTTGKDDNWDETIVQESEAV